MGVKIMSTSQLTIEQVVQSVKQLSLQGKQAVLIALAEEHEKQRDALLTYGEGRIRHICSQRGIDWTSLTDEERERFIDDLLHEE